MDSYWIDIIHKVVYTLLPPLLIAIGVYLRNWLKKKGATEEQLILIDEAYVYLTRAVTATNQVWVDALKAAGNGLTKEQQAEARAKTEEAFRAMLTDTVQLAIETAYGSIEKWLDINLEAAVGEVKNNKATA